MKLREHWERLSGFLGLVRTEHKSVVPCMLIGGFSEAAVPFLSLYFSAQILTLVIQKRLAECYRQIFLLLTLTLIFSLISRVCRQSFNAVKENAYSSIQKLLNAKIYRMEYEKLERTETSDKIRSLRANEMTTGGIENALDYLYQLIVILWNILFSFAFVCRLLFFSDSMAGGGTWNIFAPALFLAVAALILFLEMKAQGRFQKHVIEIQHQSAHSNAVVNYLFNMEVPPENGKDIRIFGMRTLLDQLMWKVLIKTDILLDTHRLNGRINGWITLWGQIIAGGAYFLIGLRAVQRSIPIGDVLLYVGAIVRLADAVQKYLSTSGNLWYNLDYLQTYQEFINSPTLSYDGTLPIEKRDDGQYEFEFQDVCFSYPGSSKLILDHLNLKLTVGKSFAVVGRNGAGKTTLVKLLCRLYEPTSGRILLNGIDIRYYDYREYVGIFSVVFQDFKIFAFPLDQNVSSSENADEQRVWSCLANVGLRDRVEAMPDGIRTNLYKETGEGVELSGGEAQKLAIARALYKNGPFVILDEPTAALDPFSEAEIYENFGELTKNKTAVYISHRMSSCKFCDEIIVMENGRIAERGNHESLMEADGLYARLYRVQAEYYENSPAAECP